MSNPRLPKRLGPGSAAKMPTRTKEELLDCAGRVLSAAGPADLVFVGRSPENLYDVLCGALADTPGRDRVHLLQLSLRRSTPGTLRRAQPGALARLWRDFAAIGLTPQQLLQRERPVAFVDLVFSGQTLGNLYKVLRHWTGGRPGQWELVRRRIRWVAIVERGHPDYVPWDPSECRWTRQFPPESFRRVFLDSKTWRLLAEQQPKTTDSYTVDRWGTETASRPPTDEDRLKAARLARALYRLGGWSKRRLLPALV